ncbi:conserved hypothetical protein of the DUF498/DUF598 family [Candidatus Kinetoplastibacterium oncopeltii TCC290E]|uniref:Uncharacterized protein n=1 Tax=Candidatus Kinetoplastidibacterium stringomonadis TCC290E TaxID=1208920 RepID=M1LS42_9PROT|nr:Mth938-like domain-containing protein [Candidatus Kinetoplastibacterium oncopeltii]AGF48362.1 conserved hypothetical protein of the DUF498/DUF598 family [Candidatus Kinetoplastibacterium oncopeltii TCC290E]
MKLHYENNTSNNVINSYKEGSISINGIIYTDNILFSKNGKILKWDILDVHNINYKILLYMLESIGYPDNSKKPIEFILIGAGNKYNGETINNITNIVSNIGIGIEIMKTQSAVYTYNAMLMQDRQVLIALILGD